jgi:hypothetical protein
VLDNLGQPTGRSTLWAECRDRRRVSATPSRFPREPSVHPAIAYGSHDDLLWQAETRHIYLNASHSTNPKPSWYGESIGHYEGDTLVIDTIGLNNKTFLDNWRTPHTDKLHVTERWRMIEDGKKLEILMTIDDPDTFNQPWQALRQFERVKRNLVEDVCSENNINPLGIDYGTPVAEKPDF